MTVKELIKELQKLDKNADVEIENGSLTMNTRGELEWAGSGTREAHTVIETKSKYSDRKIVVIR